MANALYGSFKFSVQNKEQDLNAGDTIKVTLIDSADYTFSSAHTTYATDVGASAKVAVATLTTPTVSSSGTFDTDDWVFTLVTGDQSEALITWNDTPTTPTADPLIGFYDTSITGMPVTPNGGNINGTVNSSGWHAL